MRDGALTPFELEFILALFLELDLKTNFGFMGKGLTLTPHEAPSISGTMGGAFTSNTHEIDVPANARFAFVQLDWGAAAGEDEAVVDNTRIEPARAIKRSEFISPMLKLIAEMFGE